MSGLAERCHERRVLDRQSGMSRRTTRRMDTIVTEEWRPVTIANFCDSYEVSNFGNVRSIDRMRMGLAGPQRCFGRILMPRTNRVGYPQVNLCKDGRTKTINIHRLVAIAFVPNPNDLPMVNHIDGDKTNACATNLEWVNDAGNKLHAIRADEVAEIRLLGGTMRQVDIAERFGTTQTNISLILLGKNHKAVST